MEAFWLKSKKAVATRCLFFAAKNSTIQVFERPESAKYFRVINPTGGEKNSSSFSVLELARKGYVL